MARHARLAMLILRRRCKTRSALLATGHNTLEEVGRTVADSGGRRLIGAVGTLCRATALFELMA